METLPLPGNTAVSVPVHEPAAPRSGWNSAIPLDLKRAENGYTKAMMIWTMRPTTSTTVKTTIHLVS